MEFRDTPEETAFRTTVREFLDAEFPPDAAARRPPEWGLFNAGGGGRSAKQKGHKPKSVDGDFHSAPHL